MILLKIILILSSNDHKQTDLGEPIFAVLSKHLSRSFFSKHETLQNMIMVMMMMTTMTMMMMMILVVMMTMMTMTAMMILFE